MFLWAPSHGCGSVFDSCLLLPFPPTGLPGLALIRRFVSSLTVICYAIFSWYPWEACSFVKGNRGVVDLGEREGEETVSEERREGRLQLGCNVMREEF